LEKKTEVGGSAKNVVQRIVQERPVRLGTPSDIGHPRDKKKIKGKKKERSLPRTKTNARKWSPWLLGRHLAERGIPETAGNPIGGSS